MLNALARINLADALYHDGNLDESCGIWRKLSETESSADIIAISLLKLARTCRRLQRYDEAQQALRRLRRLVRSGALTDRSLTCKAQLSLAMLRYEQGRVEEARSISNEVGECACNDLSSRGKHLNLLGLLAGVDLFHYHRMLPNDDAAADPEALPALLEIAAHYFRQALSTMARSQDYQFMQSACLNLGNLYLGAYRAKLPLPDRNALLAQGIAWITQCEFVCSKFGVGMDSVQRRIVWLNTALSGGLELSDLNRMSGGLFKSHIDLESLAHATLQESIRIGNLAEQAATLKILARCARLRDNSSGVESYCQQALAIYRKLNRPDLTRKLKAAFVKPGYRTLP